MTSIKDQINCYPSFQPNQVLTSFHLNRLSDYLAQQDRLALQKLMGVGIACGLEVGVTYSQGKDLVFITKGSGITSEGYLMALDPESCLPKESGCLEMETVTDTNKADGYLDSTPWEEACVYTHYRPFLYKGGYSPFDDAGLTRTENGIIELVQDPGDGGDDDINPLDVNQLENSVVLLYLEIVEENIDKCQEEGCNEKGKRIQHTLRKLVVPYDTMDAIIKVLPDNTAPYVSSRELYPAYGLPEVFIKRFGYVSDPQLLNLENIKNLGDFKEFYIYAIEDGCMHLETALNALYDKYKPLVDIQMGSTEDPFNLSFLKELPNLTNNFPLISQYSYDFLRDLTDTYNELTGLLYRLVARCCSNPGLFPRHLMLVMLGDLTTRKRGQYYPKADPPEKYRHHFIPSPIYNGQSDLLMNVKQLIGRLVYQINSFSTKMVEVSEIKILPCEGCASPLGHRPVPFYYDIINHAVEIFWNYELGVQARIHRVTGYHLNAEETPDRPNPLLNDICRYPNLRIEGHVGQTLKKAQEQLEVERKKYNLPFDILALKLDATFDSVYLVEEKIIADLQIHYRLLRTDLVCTMVTFLDFLESVDEKNFHNLFENVSAELMALLEEFLDRFEDSPYYAYLSNLENLIELLPKDIKDFNICEFKNACENLALFSAYVKIFMDNRADKLDVELSAFSSYLRYYIKKILDDYYIQSQLETLYTVFLDRVETFSLFSTFNKTIHGMEHIAGTTKGGTFILVYYDKNKTSDSDKKKEIDRMAVQNEEGKVSIEALASKMDKAGITVTDYFPHHRSTGVITGHCEIDFKAKESYIVVADFHLPCPISSLIEPPDLTEVCVRRTGDKTVDSLRASSMKA